MSRTELLTAEEARQQADAVRSRNADQRSKEQQRTLDSYRAHIGAAIREAVKSGRHDVIASRPNENQGLSEVLVAELEASGYQVRWMNHGPKLLISWKEGEAE